MASNSSNPMSKAYDAANMAYRPLEPLNTYPAELTPRLGTWTPARVLLGSVAATFVGFSLGATQGGQMAELRFRAEHAHKMPDTTAGWYFYHKSKNYHAMFGGISEGIRMGAKTGFWSFMALALESTVDRCRGASDMFSTTVATLTVAGTFSLWRKWSVSSAGDINYSFALLDHEILVDDGSVAKDIP